MSWFKRSVYSRIASRDPDGFLEYAGVPIYTEKPFQQMTNGDFINIVDDLARFLNEGRSSPYSTDFVAEGLLKLLKDTNSYEALQSKKTSEDRERHDLTARTMSSAVDYLFELRANMAHDDDPRAVPECWKCGSALPFNGDLPEKITCPTCGFLTFPERDGSTIVLRDEADRFGRGFANPAMSVNLHRHCDNLEHRGADRTSLEKAIETLSSREPPLSDTHIVASLYLALIHSARKMGRLDTAASLFDDLARFFYDADEYHFEAAWNANAIRLLDADLQGYRAFRVDMINPCVRCREHHRKVFQIVSGRYHPPVPRRDCMATGYRGHEDPDGAIADGEVIGQCPATIVPSEDDDDDFLQQYADQLNAELSAESKRWGEAMRRVRSEFADIGVNNPDEDTPGFMERAHEIYQSLRDL